MARTPRTAAFLATALLLVVATPADADMLQLTDGRYIEGVRMTVEEEVILLHYEHGTIRVPMERVVDYVIEGVPPFEPRTEEERQKRAEGLVPFRGKWVKPDVRVREIEKEIAERKKAIEEHREHQLWRNRYQFKTKHFEFQSTLDMEVNEEYSMLLETYFKEFSKLWKVKVPKDWGKLPVCFYHDRDSFNRTAGVSGGVLAYYRFVAPRELDFFYDRRDPDQTVAAMFHEANHYLTDLMDERFQYPHWINEGMAEYYGASVWDSRRNEMKIGGIQHGRLAEARADIDAGKWYSLGDLVSSEARDYEHYYWGWSFVHFMMESPDYSKRFRTFFADLARARDVDRTLQGEFEHVSGAECKRVFMKRLKVDDLEALQEEWYAHIKDMLEQSKDDIRGIEEAGLRAYQQGRIQFRAPRLLKEAVEKGSTNLRVYVCYANLLAIKEETRAEALELLAKACEIDSLDADVWANRGFLLLNLGEEEEGTRMLELAKEMNPDDDYLQFEILRKLREKAGEGK